MTEAFVIGMGEVGPRLTGALEKHGVTVHPVTRTDGWERALDLDNPGPRIVAVREEALADVLTRFPDAGRDRLVLVQNGFLEAVHGDLGPVTRGLIYFTAKGDFFKLLRGSPFYGPLAGDLVPPLAGLGAALLSDERVYLSEMIIKGAWNCIVGLPLAVKGVDLATYQREHADHRRAVVDEAARVASAEYGVSVTADQVLLCLDATTDALGWVKGGAKALAWRNGAVARFGRKHGIETPVNDELLRAVDWDPDSKGHLEAAPPSA